LVTRLTKQVVEDIFFGYDCIRCGSRFPIPRGNPDYPDFEKIVKECKKKINEKFSDYGNSWKYNHNEQSWKIRIQDEIDEIWQSTTPEQMTDEIIDAINVLSMMKENVKDFFRFEFETESVSNS